MGSFSTKTQDLFLFLPPLIFTNFCTCWRRFNLSITLWHFTRKPTLSLNSYQYLRSLLRLAIGEAYLAYMEPSSHDLVKTISCLGFPVWLRINRFFFNKNTRLVTSFTPFDFYEPSAGTTTRNYYAFKVWIILNEYVLLFVQNIFPILIGQKHTHNSPQPATYDQIWKNFAINQPMTSKV